MKTASILITPQILLEMEHSLEKLLHKLVERVMERPHMVCAQVWLIEKGDLCATCARRPECPNHLVAARGRSLPGPRKPQPSEDLNARVPLNVAQARALGCSWMQRRRAGEGVWL